MGFLTIRPEFKNGDKFRETLQLPKNGKNVSFNKDSKVTDAGFINDSLTLKLKVTGDVTVDREFKVVSTQLHKYNNFAPFIFHDNGDGYYSFTVTIIMKNDWDYYKLDYLYRNRIPLNIVVDAYSIPNGFYMMSDATSRKVIRSKVWELDLKFTRYFDISISKKFAKQKHVDELTKKISKCTYAKWTKKTYVIHSKTKKKVKQDVNDCNKIVLQILNKKGFLNKKFIGTNWEQWYKRKKVEVTKTKSKLKDTSGNAATLVEKKKTNETETVYPCKVALKKFQKAWNKKKLKPQLKENGKKDKNTLAALKRYKEL